MRNFFLLILKFFHFSLLTCNMIEIINVKAGDIFYHSIIQLFGSCINDKTQSIEVFDNNGRSISWKLVNFYFKASFIIYNRWVQYKSKITCAKIATILNLCCDKTQKITPCRVLIVLLSLFCYDFFLQVIFYFYCSWHMWVNLLK